MQTSHEFESTDQIRKFEVFSSGTVGAMHAHVHQCLHAQNSAEAAALLERFLLSSPTVGPHSLHLHWHMLVLDIERGRPEAARVRFLEQVWPFIPLGWARCDAPAGLWHLALAFDGAKDLPWETAAQLSAANLEEHDPLLSIHDALALAGAEALPELERWTEQRRRAHEGSLAALGFGLRAWVRREWTDAARWLSDFRASNLRYLCGSKPQWELFDQLAATALTRARST